MNRDLCIVLTARMGSSRLPGKALVDVEGKPLLYWIMRRLSAIGNVVLGITTEPEDDQLATLGKIADVPVFRWQRGDVVGTVDGAVKQFYPDVNYVMRGLGDMPWLSHELVNRACKVLRKHKADTFVWALAPNVLPIYGSREFPYQREAWQRIAANSTVREHVDHYFHSNRNLFNIIYHEPPPNIYFRSYRTEVDWPEDLAMVRGVAAKVSMLAPVSKIVEFLDQNQSIARLNQQRVEITGPSCYDYTVQRSWLKNMIGKPILDWQDEWWPAPNDGKGQPIFCKSGQCLLGFAASDGIVVTKAGRFKAGAYLNCQCGSNLLWHGKL